MWFSPDGRRVLTHGVDGWLVPPRDPAALAAGIATLLGDPALRARLAQAGLHTVRQRFALADYAEKLAWIIHEVAAGRSAALWSRCCAMPQP